MQVSSLKFPVRGSAFALSPGPSPLPAGIPGYRGFSQPLALRPGQEAWVPWEEGGKTRLALREYRECQESQPVFGAEGGQRRRIPSPFVRRKSATYGLAVGSPVLTPFASGSRYGRVSAILEDRVTVDLASPHLAGSAELSLYDVIPLDGSAHFGAPVVYRLGSNWCWGQLLSEAGPMAWVLNSRGQVLEVGSVSLRTVAPARFAVGDEVFALDGEVMRPARVVAVLHNEICYAVMFEGRGREELRNYSQVTSPLGG